MSEFPNKGGHVSGHLRQMLINAFDTRANRSPKSEWYEGLLDDLNLIDIPIEGLDTRVGQPASSKEVKFKTPLEMGHWLCGQLWNSTDIMPDQLCQSIGVPLGSTYAQGVRKLKSEMRED